MNIRKFSLNRNSTRYPFNVTENSNHTTGNCSSVPCKVNTTDDTLKTNMTSVPSIVTGNLDNIPANCSSNPCQINTTNDTPSRNSTSLPSNGTENSNITLRNCSRTPCQVNSTNSSLNTNITGLLSSTKEISTNTTKNCSSSFCPINRTNHRNFTELVQAYKTEFYTVVSLPVFTHAKFTILFSKKYRLSVTCSFDPGDGSSLSYGNATNTFLNFSHRYMSYGIFRTRVQRIGNSSTFLHISRRVFVNLTTHIQNLSCPDEISTNRTMFCVLNVLQGGPLDVKVSIGDGMEINHNLSGKIGLFLFVSADT